MKPESQQIIIEALKERGELPLTWDCGCDESVLGFSGWSDNWAHLSSTVQTSLLELQQYIIEKLNLPGAGALSDEGKGRVYLDSNDGAVKLNYSSKYQSFEVPEVELAEVLRYVDHCEITIDELEVADFRFDIFIDADKAKKGIAEKFSATPELEKAPKRLVLACLNEYLPEFEKQYWMKNKRSNKDFVTCRSLEVDGSWTLAEKKLVFNRWCGISYLEHDLKDQLVTLF